MLFLPIFSIPSVVWSDVEDLKSLVSQAEKTESDAILILQDNKILYENYYGKSDVIRSVQSITKSVVVMGIMILLDEKKIPHLDVPFFNWIPEWRTDSLKKQITLRMVLNHTAGFSENSLWPYDNGNVVSESISSRLRDKPGLSFHYSNVGTALLDRVISNVCQMSTESFIAERIFAPLEIAEWEWLKDDSENLLTSGGLFMSARSLLKIGQLMMGRGNYNGKQIFSTERFNELVSKSQSQSNYGLLWWIHDPGSYYAYGWGGQFIVINPAKKIIAVRVKNPVNIILGTEKRTDFANFPEIISKWK